MLELEVWIKVSALSVYNIPTSALQVPCFHILHKMYVPDSFRRYYLLRSAVSEPEYLFWFETDMIDNNYN